MGSGSRGTRTHKRPSAAACFQDRSLIQPDGFRQCWLAVKIRGLESNQRLPRSERGAVQEFVDFPMFNSISVMDLQIVKYGGKSGGKSGGDSGS